MAFSGLGAETFATYTPDKWSSMVHNLARMKAKDTMVALCDAAQAHLDDTLGGLARAASDEIPNITNQKKVDAQWVYWFRDKDARESLASFLKKIELSQAHIFDLAPQDKHAILAVVIRESELWVGHRIAAAAEVDRKNLVSKLGKSWERESLVSLLQELPQGATLGLEGDTKAAHELTPNDLHELAGRFNKTAPAFVVGHAFSPEEAVELGADLAHQVGRWLSAMAPVYRFSAWSRDNDFIEATKQIQEEKAAKRRQATSYKKGDKVRVISGMFTGKNGVVESVDTKAKVKVRVGTMSVVVSGHDLVPA